MQPIARPGTISLPTATISPSLMTAAALLMTVLSELEAVIRSAAAGLQMIKDGSCQPEGGKQNSP